MASVMTVSANTAAYVADNLRVLNGVQRHTSVKEAITALEKKTRGGQDDKFFPVTHAVKPSALAIHFMMSGMANHPQASQVHVEEAYDEQSQELT